jgi:surface antigen
MSCISKKTVLAATMSVCLLSGCQTLESDKQGIGAAIGAVVGGVIGSKVGDEDNKELAALIGMGIGAYIGSEIGKHLDEQDRQRLAIETKNTFHTGKSSEWENPETGVKGEIVVKETRSSDTNAQVKVLKKRVKEVPPLDIRDSGVYMVKKASNVRGGPSTEYIVVEKLASKSNVDVLGKVENKPWYLIGTGDIAKGFVYASLLEPTGQPINAAAVSNVSETELGSVEVSAKRTCRTIEQTVTLKNGEVVSDTITACQQPDGTWA